MKILFFDGYCSLCNTFVDWLMRRDQGGQLYFASLQGQTAQAQAGLVEAASLDTVIYLREGQILIRSSAVIAVLKDLGGVWAILAKVLGLIPASWRDAVYIRWAGARYRFFSRRQTCRRPTPAEAERLLP